MALVHRGQAVAQFETLLGQPDMDRAPGVMQRALLNQIAVFDHLLDVIGDVEAEIAAAQVSSPTVISASPILNSVIPWTLLMS